MKDAMAAPTDRRLLLLDAADNVLAVARPVAAGERVTIEGREATVDRGGGIGFKLARTAIRAGDPIVKYGAVIGLATADIPAGALVHTHNVRSAYMASTEPVAGEAGRASS